MQSLWRSLRGVSRFSDSPITYFRSSKVYQANFIQQLAGYSNELPLPDKYSSWNFSTLVNTLHMRRELTPSPNMSFSSSMLRANSTFRGIAAMGHSGESFGHDISAASHDSDQTQRIKFKRLSKTAKHIMNILDKEAVEKVQADREFPDIRPGYIIQLKVEVPENKRRVSILKGIVIARRNAGLHTTFRLRRLVAGVGVESVFPLYSPNIKEMKVLDKKKVRRAKLYYLRDRMNPLKK